MHKLNVKPATSVLPDAKNECYFNMQALDTFNTAVVSPIYYALFTTLTIFASAIMFKVSSTHFSYVFSSENFSHFSA